MVGYAGGTMFFHAAVQYLVLAGTGRIYHLKLQWLRLLLAATVGGLYAGACLLPRFSFFASGWCHLLLLMLVGILTFGISVGDWPKIATYILLNMAMEGIVVGADINKPWVFPLAAVILFILCGIGSYGPKAGARYIPMEIYHNGNQIQITALEDTGNMLTDPLTGQQVLIVDPFVAGRITGLTQHQLRNPLEVMTSAGLPGLRLIPYRTVGQECAFLLALKMQVKLGKTSGKYLVAFAPEKFGHDSTYQALTGGMI